ncbi:hypothetical protein C8R46DRAFT_1357526 [Mycena filopes]|nr:hypothetical protein C8R46DRAFT_1357526 [Mycena filopes]
MSTPSQSHTSSSAHAVELSVQEQCLRNADLLQEILDHLSSEGDRDDLKAQRQSLLWIALTCRDLSPSAMKFLWRRLDNLLPLLRLLPAFVMRDGIYRLTRVMQPHEWECFDRRAALVKEIVYDPHPSDAIESSVYVGLALHTSPILPNLKRFVWGADVFSNPSESESLLYAQSPLQSIEIQNFFANGFTTLIPYLPGTPSHISRLILNRQPRSVVLSDLAPFGHLTSLELRFMVGVSDATLLRRIGSLPLLRSLTIDSTCVNSVTDIDRPLVGSELQESPHRSLFKALTHLHLEGTLRPRDPAIANFLRSIGTKKLQSLALWHTGTLGALVGQARGRGRGLRGSTLMTSTHRSTGSDNDVFRTIMGRWSMTLRQLDLKLDDGRTCKSLCDLLAALPGLQNLTITGSFTPDRYVTEMTRIFAGLGALESLSLACRFEVQGKARYLAWDMQFVTTLLQNSRRLRELAIPLIITTLPPLSSVHPPKNYLRKLTVRTSDAIVDSIALARYLDELCPHLSSLRLEPDTSSLSGGSERNAAWEHVQDLVFAFQDVRRSVISRR